MLISLMLLRNRSAAPSLPGPLDLQSNLFPKTRRVNNIHTSSAARHLAPLLQAFDLPAAVGLVLALHEIVIESLAAVADEVRRAGQICRGGTNLLHLGDVVRHGGGVDEDMLVEPDRQGTVWLVLVLAQRDSREAVIEGQ